MSPAGGAVPARRNIPAIVLVLLAALLALGAAYVWPW